MKGKKYMRITYEEKIFEASEPVKVNEILKEEIKSVDGNNVVGKEKDSEYAYISFPKKEPINEEETKTVYIQYVAGDRAIRYEIKDGVVINIIMFNGFYM